MQNGGRGASRSSVHVERLNAAWHSSRSSLSPNQSVLSDVFKVSDGLVGAPDLIRKSAAAASEFRRLQEYEREAKSEEARLLAQLEQQQKQLSETRRLLLDETGAFHRERALQEARVAGLEQELADLRATSAQASESHERFRKEVLIEKESQRRECSESQKRADRANDALLESDRRVHQLQQQLDDFKQHEREMEERIRKAEEGQSKANEQLISSLRRVDSERAENDAEHSKQLAASQQRGDALAADLSSLRSDFVKTKEDAAEKTAALRAAREELHASEQKIHVLRQQSASDRQVLNESERARERLQRDVTARQSDVSSLQEQLQQVQGEKRAEVNTVADLRTQICRMEAEAVTSKQRLEDATESRREAAEVIERLRKENADLQQTLTEERHEGEFRNQRLEREIKTLEVVVQDTQALADAHRKQAHADQLQLAAHREEAMVAGERASSLRSELEQERRNSQQIDDLKVAAMCKAQAWEEECTRLSKREQEATLRAEQLIRDLERVHNEHAEAMQKMQEANVRLVSSHQDVESDLREALLRKERQHEDERQSLLESAAEERRAWEDQREAMQMDLDQFKLAIQRMQDAELQAAANLDYMCGWLSSPPKEPPVASSQSVTEEYGAGYKRDLLHVPADVVVASPSRGILSPSLRLHSGTSSRSSPQNRSPATASVLSLVRESEADFRDQLVAAASEGRAQGARLAMKSTPKAMRQLDVEKNGDVNTLQRAAEMDRGVWRG